MTAHTRPCARSMWQPAPAPKLPAKVGGQDGLGQSSISAALDARARRDVGGRAEPPVARRLRRAGARRAYGGVAAMPVGGERRQPPADRAMVGVRGLRE